MPCHAAARAAEQPTSLPRQRRVSSRPSCESCQHPDDSDEGSGQSTRPQSVAEGRKGGWGMGDERGGFEGVGGVKGRRKGGSGI